MQETNLPTVGQHCARLWYIIALRAKKELESINKSLPEMKARVTAVPLNVIFKDVKTVNSKLQGKKLFHS